MAPKKQAFAQIRNTGSGWTPQSYHEIAGLRERKVKRLRDQIIATSVRLFRARGYDKTRVDDIVELLEISQPTFFRYFPSKDAVLWEVARRTYDGIRKHLEGEFSSAISITDRLRQMYREVAKEAEGDKPLWRALVLSGALDSVRSPEMYEVEETIDGLLRRVLTEGQNRGQVTRCFPAAHLAEFAQALYTAAVRRWALDFTGRHSLSRRVRSSVNFFLLAIDCGASSSKVVPIADAGGDQ